MQITFKDGSFIAINNSDINPDKLNIIVCGMKSLREVTMSSLELSEDQAKEMCDFLSKWLKGKPQT